MSIAKRFAGYIVADLAVRGAYFVLRKGSPTHRSWTPSRDRLGFPWREQSMVPRRPARRSPAGRSFRGEDRPLRSGASAEALPLWGGYPDPDRGLLVPV